MKSEDTTTRVPGPTSSARRPRHGERERPVGGVADEDRDDRHRAHGGLQERKLDLEAVLAVVGARRAGELRQLREPRDRLAVHRHLAEGRGERRDRGRRQRAAAEIGVVRRAEQDHPRELRAGERGERLAGGRAREYVPGVGRDQRDRCRRGRGPPLQVAPNVALELRGVAGVERARHGGRAHLGAHRIRHHEHPQDQRTVGQIPIRREGGSASERALASATEVLQDGGVFAIYPEGTRTRDGYLHRGHTGVARLALRTGTRSCRSGLIGTDEVQPVDKRMPRLFRRVTIRFGEPLDPARYGDTEQEHLALRELTDEVMYEIGQLSGYEYVDTYATKKAEDIPIDVAHVASFEDARTLRDRRVAVRATLVAPSRGSARRRGATSSCARPGPRRPSRGRTTRRPATSR